MPVYTIIKCSTKSVTDQSHVRVVSTTAAEIGGFNEQVMWTTTVNGVTHTRPYALRPCDGAVLTAQSSAWMDEIGVLMWIDLVVSALHAR